MHFHLPKPLHGWRALAGEVGIIVVGVLIALSAEQAVESWNWRSQAAEARSALRADVAMDLASISPAGSMTSGEVDRTAVTLHRLRKRAEGMAISSRVLIQEAREAGVAMTGPEQRQVIAELRPQWGNCVITPDTSE